MLLTACGHHTRALFQVGPRCDEEDAVWKVPRFLGYAGACRGPVDSNDEVEALNPEDEELLRTANERRAENARTDEKNVTEFMEKFFEDHADPAAREGVNEGKRPKWVLDRIAAEEAAEKQRLRDAAQAAVSSAAQDIGATPEALAAAQDLVKSLCIPVMNPLNKRLMEAMSPMKTSDDSVEAEESIRGVAGQYRHKYRRRGRRTVLQQRYVADIFYVYY